MSHSKCQLCSQICRLADSVLPLVLYLQGRREAVVRRQVEGGLPVDIAGVDVSPQRQQVLHDLSLVCRHGHEQGSLGGHPRAHSEN